MSEDSAIRDLKDVVDVSQEIHGSFAHQPWWRGHARSGWRLRPHVFRITRPGTSYEATIANKFAKYAPTRYANCPAPGDVGRWLFLMQHYRLPTRLLDWSESPLLAIYFAVAHSEIKHQKAHGALWALDPFRLNELVTNYAGLFQPGQGQAKHLIEQAFSHAQPKDKNVIAVVTEEIDIRMMAQLSGLTIHGSPTPLDARKDREEYLKKFVIHASAKERIRGQLEEVGIRERTVFPDLEHLAVDLSRDRYVP